MRAIKMLDSESVQATADNQEEVKREVEIQSMLSIGGEGGGSEHVCRLYECAYDHACICLVLEFCDLGDLYGSVATGQLPLGDNSAVQDVFSQLMAGLVYVQVNGITHMDMKIENIMLSSCADSAAGRVAKLKIIDFGFCLAGDQQPQSEGGRGTTRFMSPEVYAVARVFSGFKADMWSAGIILFILLSGSMPLEFPDMADENFRLIKEKGVRFLVTRPSGLKSRQSARMDEWRHAFAGVSPAAVDLLGRLLSIDPSRRPTPQEALSHPWLAPAGTA
jgi:calcium-dependent protein kinase